MSNEVIFSTICMLARSCDADTDIVILVRSPKMGTRRTNFLLKAIHSFTPSSPQQWITRVSVFSMFANVGTNLMSIILYCNMVWWLATRKMVGLYIINKVLGLK